MKKLFAIMLALMLVLTMGSALATEEPTYSDASTVTVTKTYESKGVSPVSPAETFTFSAIEFVSATDTGTEYSEDWARENVPTIDSISYTEGEAGSGTKEKTATITLPKDYPSVGVYTYKFSENDGNTAGVKYRSSEIKLVVTVIEQNGQKRVAAVHCEENDTKTGTFENTYTAGTLTVTKKVDGLLGDKDKDFAMKVTFTAPTGDTVRSNITYTVAGGTQQTLAPTAWVEGKATVEFALADGQSVTFNNIPAGVEYVVAETDAAAGDKDSGKEYTVTYDGSESGTIGSEAVSTLITNTKGGTIDTGITTDNLPYIVLMGIVVLAGVAMIAKRRMAHND